MPTLEALRERQRVDHRLLIIYGILVVILAISLTYISWDINKGQAERAQFERAVVTNCIIGQKNVLAFNKLLDNLIKSVQTNPAYTDADKQPRLMLFESARQSVPNCPPVDFDKESPK